MMAQHITQTTSASRSKSRHTPGPNQTLLASAYLGPALIGILIVSVFPILYNLYMSITNRNGPARFAEGKYRIVGLDNYIRLVTQPDFYIVFGRTLLYAVVCVTLFFIIGLAFALILNHPAIKGVFIWRTLMILPWAVPTWITALIWKFMFHGQYGPINQLLATIGIQGPDWLLDGTTAFIAITLVNLWMSYPFFMLILLGGLQAIPADMYEAAGLDGAGWWQQLFNVTLPLLRPVALPAVILSLIAQVQMFNTVWLMTKGGPVQRVGQPGATELLLIWAYNQGFQGAQRFGLVSAFAIVVFIILLGITLLYIRTTDATKGVYE
jgi:arabinogalactan oligomer/maltooligosaccharide transport system permease protein